MQAAQLFFSVTVLCPLQCPNFLHLLSVTFILVLKSVENFLLKMDPSLGKKKKKKERNEKRVKNTTQGKFLCKQSVKEVWFLWPTNTTICNSALTFPQRF